MAYTLRILMLEKCLKLNNNIEIGKMNRLNMKFHGMARFHV